ncbi:MAG: PQQ-binding-like beta-propeller repeat protein [Rhodobacteraceae bacterium]|nr:PQQ-binding-like beta-propeller repeat protein [Paracoccaceae bacterium]
MALCAAGCAEREVPLAGERLDVRSPVGGQDGAAPLDAAGPDAAAAPAPAAPDPALVAGPRRVPVSLPGAQANAEWTQAGGGPAHAAGNLALGPSLTRVWTAPAGAGDSRRARIAADPVVAAGRVYTVDSQGRVTATSTSGATLWQTDITPATEKPGENTGNGLAFGQGRLFVTTGFGELVALDAATGGVVWRQRFDTAVGGAPAYADGTVYVVARDASGAALRAADGKILWILPGTPSNGGVPGSAAPAVEGGRVFLPYAGGELLAVNAADGLPVWTAYVAGRRLGRAATRVSDLTGDPVVAGGTVLAGSSAGRLVAFDSVTGTRFWAADEGASDGIVTAGGAVWFVSDENQLVRLDAATGEVVWRIDMPFFEKQKDRKREAIFVQYGPVLAGGRLITASSDGVLRAFDPASGALLAAAEIPGGAASSPVVAGGTLYVMSRNGQLHAFR